MLRVLSLSVCVIAVCAIAAPREAAAASTFAPLTAAQVQAVMSSPTRHVRAVDSRIERVIADGLRRSGTFAQLVLALDSSDVIVYIESGRGLPSTLAGRMLLAAGPQNQRYLRIQVNGQPRSNELIALVGHELRHAVEVAESPDVRDAQSLLALYQRIGHPGSMQHNYDTLAAQNTGRQVRIELTGL
ncbi:MAG: hypothetical protein ABI818_06180 [Acidobacteriota bacterium]